MRSMYNVNILLLKMPNFEGKPVTYLITPTALGFFKLGTDLETLMGRGQGPKRIIDRG